MTLYKDLFYPEEKHEVKGKNIVDLLTNSETRIAINIGFYNTVMERQDKDPFAINYALRKGDRSPFLRGIQWNDKLYEIDSDKNLIIEQPMGGQLFYDLDKMDEEYIFEGIFNDFINEFIERGYTIHSSTPKYL